MKTIAQLCDQMRALTHADLSDLVHIGIADTILAAPRDSSVMEQRLVAAHEWVESADVSARDAERNISSARSKLNRAIRILEGLHAK